MKKRDQNGFSPMETVLVLVIIGLVTFIAWYTFKSQSDTNAILDNAANSQAQPTKSTARSQTKTTAEAKVVQTKTDSKAGDYLADADGKTLYTSNGDTSGVSNCSGSCLETWPIYNAAAAPTTLPTDVTVIKRADGSSQYAYKGMPLYHYANEPAGTVSGTSISGWQVAKP